MRILTLMLHKIGSQVCFQTFAKRFFGMFYGKHSTSLEVNLKSTWELSEQTLKGAAAKLSQHTSLPIAMFFSAIVRLTSKF